MKILYPDIPFLVSSISCNATFATGDEKNLVTGSRADTFRITSSTTDNIFVNYDLGSGVSQAASSFGICRADLLQSQFVNDVILRSSRQHSLAPQQVGNLAAWYDANRGVTYDSLFRVSQWNDLSGNGRHASQSTGSKQPLLLLGANGINGNRCIQFDNSDDSVACSTGPNLSQPVTFIMFLRYDTLEATGQTAFQTATTGAMQHYVSPGTFVHLFQAGVTANSGHTAAANTSYVISVIFNGASSSYYVNGVLTASGVNCGANVINGIRIGNNSSETQGVSAKMGELLIFNAALSSSDRQLIEQYLLDKWVTVPAYKNNSFLSQALIGPRQEDFVTTFNASSSNRYFYVQFGATSASNYEHSKEFFGDTLDLGRFPANNFSNKHSQKDFRTYTGSSEYEFTIPGLTASVVSQVHDSVINYQDVNPVVIYDPNNYFLNGASCLHAQIVESDIQIENQNHYKLRLLVEELL